MTDPAPAPSPEASKLPGFLRGFYEWTMKGPKPWQMVKTSCGHAAVVIAATSVFGVAGLLTMGIGGLRGIWAAAWPLLGYAMAMKFYDVREFSNSGDFLGYAAQKNWLGMLDSAMDFLFPWILGAACVYLWLWLYRALG